MNINTNSTTNYSCSTSNSKGFTMIHPSSNVSNDDEVAAEYPRNICKGGSMQGGSGDVRLTISDDAKLLPNGFSPGNFDVICCRGKSARDHTGNRRFRLTININLGRYREAKTKLQKSLVVSDIVDSIRSASPDGGFVRLEQGRWFEVGDHAAREKVGQCLRDRLHTAYKSSSKAKCARRKSMEATKGNKNKTSTTGVGTRDGNSYKLNRRQDKERQTDSQETGMKKVTNREIGGLVPDNFGSTHTWIEEENEEETKIMSPSCNNEIARQFEMAWQENYREILPIGYKQQDNEQISFGMDGHDYSSQQGTGTRDHASTNTSANIGPVSSARIPSGTMLPVNNGERISQLEMAWEERRAKKEAATPLSNYYFREMHRQFETSDDEANEETTLRRGQYLICSLSSGMMGSQEGGW